VVASVQYRALAEKASDAFYSYKLSNTKAQIQAYVFDVQLYGCQMYLTFDRSKNAKDYERHHVI